MENRNHLQSLTGNKVYALLFIALIFICRQVTAQEFNWAVSAGGTVNQDKVFDIASDSDSNVYIAGTVRGSNVIFASETFTTGGNTWGYIAKYDRFHNFIWLRIITNDGNTAVKNITIDSFDQLYATGTAEGDASFGNGVSFSSSGDTPDIFVAKYDLDGNAQWAKRIGSDEYAEVAGKITSDKYGFVYVCGTIDSYGNEHAFIDTNEFNLTGQHIFMAKYDSLGNVVWIRTTTNPGTSPSGTRETQGISVVNDDLYLTGFITVPTTFGTTTIETQAYGHIFLAKYDLDGDQKWIKSYKGHTYPYDLAADSLNSIYITARHLGGLYLENDTLNSDGLEFNDALIMCFDSLGNRKWQVLAGDYENDLATSVSADGLGNAYITGQFMDSIHFMGIDLYMDELESSLFVAKISGSGELKWFKMGQNVYGNSAWAIHKEPHSNRLYVGGHFWLTATYGVSTITDNGNADIMLIQMADTTFDVTPTIGNVSCSSNCDGSILVLSNGHPPFQYQWAHTTADTNYLENLCAGFYDLRVTDAFGRIRDLSIEVGSNMQPHINFLAPVSELCVDADSVELSGASPVGGTYQVNGSDETIFRPGELGPGSHTVSYTFTDDLSCTGSVTHTITVNDLPVITYSESNDTLCVNSLPVNLTDALPAGGTYSGNGISSNTFSAALAGSGTHEVSYTYTDANGCTNSATQNIGVYAVPFATYIETNNEVCLNESPFNLSPGNPAGGYYTGTGVSGQNFDPASAGVGTHIVKYIYVDQHACRDTVNQPLVVYSLPTVSFSLQTDTLCNYLNPFSITGGSPSGGAYSGNGVSNGQFSPGTAGAGLHYLTYSFTNSNGCSASAQDSILVLNCAGLDAVQAENAIRISPNPAENSVFISTGKQIAQRIIIFDFMGKSVLEFYPLSNEILLDISPLAAGIYTILFEIDHTTQNFSLIKKP